MRAWLPGVVMVLLMTPRLTGGAATPFQLGDQGGVIVPVTVNGAGPFMMLLDTGATHSAITAGLAAAVGARIVAKSVVLSATGETVRAIASVDRLGLGPIVAETVLPSIVDDGALGAGIRGVVGQDVLARLRYTLDFKSREVEWHDDELPRRGVRLDLAFEHGRFLVNLPQATRTLRLVPDSGAGGLVLFNATASGHGFVETGQAISVRTADSRREARQVRLRELRLGDWLLRDVPAVAIDRADVRPAEGDGLLPLHLFERVTFDGPGRVLILG